MLSLEGQHENKTVLKTKQVKKQETPSASSDLEDQQVAPPT